MADEIGGTADLEALPAGYRGRAFATCRGFGGAHDSGGWGGPADARVFDGRSGLFTAGASHQVVSGGAIGALSQEAYSFCGCAKGYRRGERRANARFAATEKQGDRCRSHR